jgi:UDP-GlcNAc:undecaprenyl-phosphate GlcNAc-1-phosphate transferase
MLAASIALVGFAGAVGVGLTALVRAVGERAMLLDSPGSRGHRKALRRVPNIGGVAIAGTILLVTGGGLGASVLFRALLRANLEPELAEHLAGVRQQSPLVWTLLAGVLWLHVLGVADDRRPLGPHVKLVLMLAPCVVLPASFPEARLLTLLGPGPAIALTAVWLLAVTNAINFMDNMDGLAGSVAACAATVLFVFALLSEQWFIAAFAGVVIGACLGFLAYNAPPAKLFMGDGGSLVLGYTLGALAVLTTYAALPAEAGGGAALAAVPALFMPIAILATPLYDLVSVSLIRLSQGKSPLVGDQQHVSHRLRARGLGPDSVVAVVAGLTLVAGLSGVAMAFVPLWLTPVLAVQVVVAVLVLALLERRTKPRDASAADRAPPTGESEARR